MSLYSLRMRVNPLASILIAFLGAAIFMLAGHNSALAQAGGPLLPGGAQSQSPAPGGPGPGTAFDLGDEQEEFTFEKTEEQIEKEMREQAFENALDSLLPLRPEEIRTLLEHFDRTQESVEVPVYPAPKPEFAVQNIPLDPGTKPATVKVAFGHVSTLAFLDSTGSPWPIQDISWAGDFEIIDSGGGEDGNHLLRITPQSEFAFGNMSIRLLTLKTPVILTMETSRDIVHYRFDAIIPDYGPLASAPLIEQGISTQAGGGDIASILEGIIPEGAERLAVSGVDGRTSAYKFGDITYVRTPHTLLSPSWSQSVASADGMRVFEIQNAPVLLLSAKGKMVRARLSAREAILDE